MACKNDAGCLQGALAATTGVSTFATSPTIERLKSLKYENLPPGPQKVALALHRAGFRPLLAGGIVRDTIIGRPAKDFDFEVEYGSGPEQLKKVLECVAPVSKQGNFEVYALNVDGEEIEVAMRRLETKSGFGPNGFIPQYSPGISDEEAAARRDFTMNSMCFDPFDGSLLDPFDGVDDIEAGVMRHTSPAFAEDPVRVMRGWKFAGRYNMEFAAETAAMGAALLEDYAAYELLLRFNRQGGGDKVFEPYGVERQPGESVEDAILRAVRQPGALQDIVANPSAPDRVWKVWSNIRAKGRNPMKSLQAILDSGWGAVVPELVDLNNIPQDPEWHPEGNGFVHTGETMSAAQAIAERDGLIPTDGDDEAEVARKVRTHSTLFLAILGHDLGKVNTTFVDEENGRIRSPGHAQTSLPLAKKLFARIGVPLKLQPAILRLIDCHMDHLEQEPTQENVSKLAERLHPATIRQWSQVVEADVSGRPAPGDPRDELGRPFPVGDASPGKAWLDVAEQMGCADSKIHYVVSGGTLRSLGMKPSKRLGDLLWRAEKAQRQGKFDTRDGAISWLRHNAQKEICLLGGGDVIRETGMKPGPGIGQVMSALFDAQMAGEVKTKGDALEWLKGYAQVETAVPV